MAVKCFRTYVVVTKKIVTVPLLVSAFPQTSAPRLETYFSLMCSMVFGMHRWLQVGRILFTLRANDMSECQIMLLHNLHGKLGPDN